MKLKTAPSKLRILLIAASLAVAFVFSFYDCRESEVGLPTSSPIEELVYRSANHSAIGCSRFHNGDSEVSTQALTGFAPSQLKLMPRSFWKYDAGSISISFRGVSPRCEGASCSQPTPSQENTFGTSTDVPPRMNNNQITLANFAFAAGDANLIESALNGDLIYKSNSYDTMERPPNSVVV